METTAGERGPWLEQNSLNSLCGQHEEAFLACLSLTVLVEAGEMIILAFFSLLGWPQSTCVPLQWDHRKEDNSYAFRKKIIYFFWGQSICSPLTLVSCAPTDKTLALPNTFLGSVSTWWIPGISWAPSLWEEADTSFSSWEGEPGGLLSHAPQKRWFFLAPGLSFYKSCLSSEEIAFLMFYLVIILKRLSRKKIPRVAVDCST